MMAADILVVDDEPDIRMLIDGVLRDEGYNTRQAANADEAIAAFQARRPGLVILDIWLRNSRLDGLGILDVLCREEPRVPVMMISGHGTIETAVTAIQKGAYDFIEKPFKADRLLLMVRRALEAARLAAENAELRLRIGAENSLLGESSAMQALRGSIERVAPTGSRVLISGPAGVGKEVAARMVHALSRRSDQPFVALNCATLNPGRFEEELFGVEASNGGYAAGDAGQDRAGAAGSGVSAGGRIVAGQRRCAGDRDDESGPAGGDFRRAIPRGSVLPALGRALAGAGFAAAARGCADAGGVFPAPGGGECGHGAARAGAGCDRGAAGL
jgi:DNA-binding NtrC family response regulator